MAYRPSRLFVFLLFVSASLAGCNRGQRAPIREDSLESVLEAAPPGVATASLAAGPSEAPPDCSAAALHVTRCLGPAGGSVRVGPLGAVVATSDGMLTLEVPPAALASEVTLRIAPTVAPPWTEGYASHVYDLTPEIELAIPARLTLAYRGDDLERGLPESRLALYAVENGAWTRIGESATDTRQHAVSAPLTRVRTVGALWPLKALAIAAPRTLVVGKSQVLRAETWPEGRAVSWAVSPRTVAAIDPRTGRLTGLAAGHARVVASGAGLLRAAEVEIVLEPEHR